MCTLYYGRAYVNGKGQQRREGDLTNQFEAPSQCAPPPHIFCMCVPPYFRRGKKEGGNYSSVEVSDRVVSKAKAHFPTIWSSAEGIERAGEEMGERIFSFPSTREEDTQTQKVVGIFVKREDLPAFL